MRSQKLLAFFVVLFLFSFLITGCSSNGKDDNNKDNGYQPSGQDSDNNNGDNDSGSDEPQNPNDTEDNDSDSIIADPNLEAVIRETLNKDNDPLTAEDLQSLQNLQANNKGITELEGLQYCTNLQILNLADNSIVDVVFSKKIIHR